MPDSLKESEVAASARALGKDPKAALRQEAFRQGYTRGAEPAPPARVYGDPNRTLEQEDAVREKARAGKVITQEDL